MRALQCTARKRAKRAKLKAKKAADHLAKKSKKAGEQCEEKIGEALRESDEEEDSGRRCRGSEFCDGWKMIHSD